MNRDEPTELIRRSSCLVHVHSTNRTFLARKSMKQRKLYDDDKLLTRMFSGHVWHYSWPKSLRSQAQRRPSALLYMSNPSELGVRGGAKKASHTKIDPAPAAPPPFPPEQMVAIKAIACEMPAQHERPLSRLFVPDIVDIALAEGVVDAISPSSVWRILDADALKPWRQRTWIYPRDPQFFERAAPVLDLYAGKWRGKPLQEDEFVISADEKTSIQARRRTHPTQIHTDGRGQRVAHDYERKGAWAYLAAWDVHRAKVFGRVEKKTGIAPFGRLVDQVMRREPYCSARRVFWIVDSGSSHHRSTFPGRLSYKYPNAQAVHMPVHASWLNQIEIYFSILQRKALTPCDFANLQEVRKRLTNFAREFNKHAVPFGWKFTRKKLREFIRKLDPLEYICKRQEAHAA